MLSNDSFNCEKFCFGFLPLLRIFFVFSLSICYTCLHLNFLQKIINAANTVCNRGFFGKAEDTLKSFSLFYYTRSVINSNGPK